jgi:HSP20 family protein
MMDEFFKMTSADWNRSSDFTPAVDIEEKDGVYHITADLPGMKKEDIKLDLTDNVLTISGERVREEKGEGKYFERSYGKFMRSFTLPKRVDVDHVKATFENGVLHVEVPQRELNASRSIKIN